MSTLTTAVLSTEILEDSLLALEQVTTSLTVLAISASAHPEHSVRLRALLSDLLEAIQEC